MYTILLALLASIATGVGVGMWLGGIAAVVPAVCVFLLIFFLVTRRIGRKVQLEVAGLQGLLEARKVREAHQVLAGIRKRYGRWQVLLDGQMQAQAGLIDYMQQKFDEALPQLEKGTFRNWAAWTGIACIHYRRDRKDEAWAAFKKAANTGSKESIIFAIWAKLLVKDGLRKEALDAIVLGLDAQPDSHLLKDLKRRVANKKAIDVKQFPQSYYQFWPEDYARQMVMRGRRGGPLQEQQMPRIGAKQTRRR